MPPRGNRDSRMEQFHSLLSRQLEKFIGREISLPDNWQAMLLAVNQAYIEFDTDRCLLESALELSSTELFQANEQLREILHELEEERVKLQHLATRDSLTGLWNRRAIFDLLSSECSRAERCGYPVTVIMADVDHFKKINDHYGHPVGDIVLQEVARRLSSCIRASDQIGRYGGEEFLIILSDCDGSLAFSRAEQLRIAIANAPVLLETVELHITASFGMNWTNAGPIDSDQLVREADAALYRAKQAGRNRVAMAKTPSCAGDSTAVPGGETGDLHTLVAR
jgi:diguanylate cyclase (GGDEF)-like protein